MQARGFRVFHQKRGGHGKSAGHHKWLDVSKRSRHISGGSAEDGLPLGPPETTFARAAGGPKNLISVEDLDRFLTARNPTSQAPEPETGPEDGKAASVPERAASAPRPASTGTSNPLAKPSSSGGQRELGQCESRGTPRIAVLASYQFMG